MKQSSPASVTNKYSQKKRYDIYVAGLPPSAEYLKIKSYFRQFGRVEKIYMYIQSSVDSRKRNSEKNSVYCKVTVSDEQTFAAIVQEQNHTFMGRSLFCQSFKRGRGLLLHNSSISNRRVVVKRVPLLLEPSQVRQLLESFVGSVESIYEFKSDLQDSEFYKNQPKRFKSFSVTLVSIEDAEKISRPLHLCYKTGENIVVERFDPNKQKDCEASFQGSPISALREEELQTEFEPDSSSFVAGGPSGDGLRRELAASLSKARGPLVADSSSYDSEATRTKRLQQLKEENFNSQILSNPPNTTPLLIPEDRNRSIMPFPTTIHQSILGISEKDRRHEPHNIRFNILKI